MRLRKPESAEFVLAAAPVAATHEPELAHGTPNVAGMGRTPPPATQSALQGFKGRLCFALDRLR
jgi:hypothetical protein